MMPDQVLHRGGGPENLKWPSQKKLEKGINFTNFYFYFLDIFHFLTVKF